MGERWGAGTSRFYTGVKPSRSQADRMFMAGELDSTLLLLVLTVAAAGATAMWRIFGAMVEHLTRIHDTQVRVAELQIGYLLRAHALRENVEQVVEEAQGRTEPRAAAA